MARAPALKEIERYPEADTLEGFAHPRFAPALIGDAHARAAAAIERQLASGTAHHAWLITGAQGIGKATLAYAIARYALAAPAERQLSPASRPASGDPGEATTGDTALALVPGSPTARQVERLSHPALLVLRRPYDLKTKRTLTAIPVDEVRRLRAFLSHANAGEGYRVVIVDSADELNNAAANALLKALEEPPSRVLFLLISAQPGRLLATIRSRCRRLELAPLDDQAMALAFRQAVTSAPAQPELASGPDDATWPDLLTLSQGSVRQALVLAANGGLALNARIMRIMAAMPKPDWRDIHALADDLAPIAKAQQFEAFSDLTAGLIARLVRHAAAGTANAQGPDREAALAHALITPQTLASWAQLWETVQRQRAATLALNLDRKALVLDVFARVARASAAPVG
ncbi:MAG: DNA polymerase III subunit delta' [Pseudomonadota bacterium]